MALLMNFLIMVIATLAANTGSEPPVIDSGSPWVSIRDGSQLKSEPWNLVPGADPDIYLTNLIDGKPHRVTFITDIDSISFFVEPGQSYDFVIQWGEQACNTRITGQHFRACGGL